MVRLIAVVDETVGTATNQTQLAKLTAGLQAQGSKTGRTALSSWRWAPNVRMDDCERVARFLRGTTWKAAGAVRNDEDQAREDR